MQSSHFSVCIIVSGLIIALIGVSVNFIVDPYSVFGTPFFPEYGQPQERYLKIEFLKSNSNFNTFLIGSSRIGVVNTDDVDSNFPGARTYNLTLSQANQWDVEKHVAWLVEHIPELSHVIVQVDWPIEFGPDRPAYKLLDEIHPDISGRGKIDFLLDYFTLFNLEGLKAKLTNNFGGVDLLRYSFSKGYWTRPRRDQRIDEDCKRYVANEKSFNTDVRPTKLSPDILDKNIDAIARYKALLESKNVRLTIFLTPHNHRMLDSIDMDDYEVFIRKLAGITGFYNFMYYSNLTTDNCNYYEWSHYRPFVGGLVVKVISGALGGNDSFRFVNDQAVEKEVDFLKANFSKNRLWLH